MTTKPIEAAELFQLLESNQPKTVEEIKSTFHELFNSVKDAWVLHGIFDYYLATNSTRAIEVMCAVREPHDKYLFDKIAESLRSPNTKNHALTLFGHVVRKQPAWLYKITQHALLKELFKLLKNETEMLPLVSALLVLIVLLPMIPGYIGPYLHEIFDIFSRVASLNTLNPTKVSEDLLLHLQVTMFSLFTRLYGMFPCTFLAYLRQQYSAQENLRIFSHTIKPWLESVRMHPLLVTGSMETEKLPDRWKNKVHHDVIDECSRYILPGPSPMASTDGFFSNLAPPKKVPSNLKNSLVTEELPLASPLPALHLQSEMWSPSLSFGLATPPAHEISHPHTPLLHGYGAKQEGSSPPEAAIEATPETTPIKDVRLPPRIPSGTAVKRALALTTSSPVTSTPASPLKKEPSPFRFDEARASTALQKIMQDRQRVLNSETSEPQTVKNGAVDVKPSRTEQAEHHGRTTTTSTNVGEDDFEDCQHSLGSPCTAGGLHMPNKQSFLDFARRVHRMRVHSVCVLSAGTSPIDGAAFPLSTKVRRSVSCPDMKRGLVVSSMTTASPPLLLDEKDEEETKIKVVAVNGEANKSEVHTCQLCQPKQCLSLGTQTAAVQPYEHLFLAVFPTPQVADPKKIVCPQTLLDQYVEAACKEHTNSKKVRVQELETELRTLRLHLQLLFLQLQFERHRREAHAERNRRLAAKTRSARALEEHNAALKEQLVLLQKALEKLQGELDSKRITHNTVVSRHAEEVTFWKDKFADQSSQRLALANINLELENQLGAQREEIKAISKELERTQSRLFDASSEVRQLQVSASLGERLSTELSHLQRELVLLGEVQQRQRERFLALPLMTHRPEETLRLKEACKEELGMLKQLLETRTSNLEAAKTRASELESLVNRKDALITEQKKLLKSVKDEYSAQVEATMECCRSTRSVNQKLQEEVVRLLHRVEVLQARTDVVRPPSQSSPLSDIMRPLPAAAAALEMTDLHSIVDSQSPPPRPRQDASFAQRDIPSSARKFE